MDSGKYFLPSGEQSNAFRMMYWQMGTGWGNTSVPGEYATHKGKCPQTHLLHVRLAIRVGLSLFMNLVLGIDVHGDSQKLLVEERNTSFYTKRHGRCRRQVDRLSCVSRRAALAHRPTNSHLLALKQSLTCKLLTRLTHSWWKISGVGAAWK